MALTGVDEKAMVAARTAVTELRRAEQRVRDTIAELDQEQVAQNAGYKSTTRLLEDLCRFDPGEAKQWVDQAARLVPGRTLLGDLTPAPMPATADACRDGDLGSKHVRVIGDAMDVIAKLPDLEPEDVVAAEELLAGHARTLASGGVAKLAVRLIDTLDPDGAAPDDSPEPLGELHLARRRGDGALKLAAIAHGADAELITEVLDALSGPAGPEDQRPLGQRRMDALIELCEQAISPTGLAADDDPTDGPDSEPARDEPAGRDSRGGGDRSGAAPGRGSPSPTGTCPPIKIAGRALLSITMDHEWLTTQIGHGTLDSGFTISPTEARKLACDSGIVPMVLDSRSTPLDVGRLSYSAPDGLRRALYHRDRGCSFPGCTRRPKRCHVHHVRHWLDGGNTASSNTTLLCRYHHHVVHHDYWVIEMRDNRPWYIPPRWIDPAQTPRPGGRFPLAG